jgi:hypothetical protein
MRSRSEVLSIYQRFAAMVLTQFSTPIHVFRADSAGEYISKQLRGVLAKQGTLAQFSCPGAHAQNGVAERKHRHLLETTRAMMIASSLPPHFWTEAVSTSIYLINIQPSTALQGGIPLERLSGRSPDFPPLLMVFLSPRKSISRIFLLVLLTVETPMELNVQLRASDGDPLPDPTRYRHLVGSLVYLVVTRPDISYPIQILSQFGSAPTTVHYSHLLRVLRYLHGTITHHLFFPRSSSLQL